MRKNNQTGAALMLVLWVIVLLTAIVSGFSLSMRTEVNIAKNFKERTEAYYAAVAGIEQAKAEILSAGGQMFLNESGELMSGEKPNRKGSLGNAAYSYIIIDEDRKINLNSATPEQLRYLLRASGVEGTELDTIIDSILDWRDADNLQRLNGAEEDYYQSLPEPYSCKDGPFDTVGELLLVKGITPEILYGSKKEKEPRYKGIVRYLTAKSSNMININTAERVAHKAGFGTAVEEDMLMKGSGPIPVPMAGGVVESSCFSIISTGSSSSTNRTIRTIVRKMDEKTVETLYWNDNWQNAE
jgi:type II secretory pathway component PulK